MKITDVAKCIEKIAPLNIQESFDNCGLLIGSPQDEVHKILICLDVSKQVLNEAVEKKCDLIISHHPLIFSGARQINSQSLIYQAIQNKIAIYAAHTNLDSAIGGVSAIWAQKLGVAINQPLQKNLVDSRFGLGVFGSLTEPLSEMAFLDHVKKVCQVPFLKHSELSGKSIRTVALCGGAGGDLLAEARALKADAYLTADLRYHHFCSTNNSFLLVDAGHFESEQFAVDILYSEISKNFPTFAVLKTQTDNNFVKYR